MKIEMFEGKYMPMRETVASGKVGDDEFAIDRSVFDGTLYYQFPEGVYMVSIRSITDEVMAHRQKKQETA